MTTIEEAVNRLRAEFLEMPGMRLTPDQVHLLCGVERGLCRALLDSLVDARFLRVSADGQYAPRHRWRCPVIVRLGHMGLAAELA